MHISEKQYIVSSEEKIKKVARCMIADSVQRRAYRCGEQVWEKYKRRLQDIKMVASYKLRNKMQNTKKDADCKYSDE